MYPLSHFLLPFFLAEILVKYGILTHQQALIAGFIGMLIDLDHLIETFVSHRGFSIKKAWNNAVVLHDIHERTFIHHRTGLIIFSIVSILLFYLNRTAFWIVALGYYSHMLLDYLNLGELLESKKTLRETLGGFVLKFPVYELIFNLLLILGIILLIK